MFYNTPIKPPTTKGALAMTLASLSLDHHLAELRQVGDDLRAARAADARRTASGPRASISAAFRFIRIGRPAHGRAARLAVTRLAVN
jgi:hypothetical protein